MDPAWTTLDPLHATEDELGAAVCLLDEADAEANGIPPRRSDHVVVLARTAPPDTSTSLEVLGTLDDPDAAVFVELDEGRHNSHVAFIDVAVAPDRRRRGLGREAVARGCEVARAAGKRTVLAVSHPGGEGAARAFAPTVGFEDALVMRASTLGLDGVDRGLVASWSSSLDPTYEVALHLDRLPDGELAAYLEAEAAMNDAPRDGLDIADEPPDPRRARFWEEITAACGGRRLTALARHRATGEGAGFSTVWWEPGRHDVVWQAGTGVAAAHRGHGLGRVLKARVLEALVELAPDAREVRTDNAHTNPWMLRINDDLGFVPTGNIVEWQRST